MATETATKAVTGKTYQLIINGEPVEPKTGETFERRNPANGENVATCPKAGPEDTDAAIQAARNAFDSGAWSKASARPPTRSARSMITLPASSPPRLASPSARRGWRSP